MIGDGRRGVRFDGPITAMFYRYIILCTYIVVIIINYYLLLMCDIERGRPTVQRQ